MYLKMLVKDYRRKKMVTIVLFAFMLLAVALAAGGSRMFLALTGAMDNLFKKANTPHYVQFHAGSYDEDYVQQWVRDNSYIKDWSTQKILSPAEVDLFMGGSSEKMDVKGSSLFFATQNEDIDILLNIDNQPIAVSDGYIALPLIFAQWSDLRPGDKLTVSFEGYQNDFVVSGFTRDDLFGSTMMGTKRFILSEGDYADMERAGADKSTAFCFVLGDENQLSNFKKEFQTSDMPQSDFFIDIALCRMAYGLGNGIIIGLILLCSVILVLIAFLTLRYTILSTIEEDFREIGVMKAIGFRLSGIIRLYLSKYIFLAFIACGLGLMLGQPLANALSDQILLYLGTPDNGAAGTLVSAGSAVLILTLILLFCLLTLGRIGKMTAIDAIRLGNVGETYAVSKLLTLSRRRLIGVNTLIGLKEVLIRVRVYGLLFMVYLLCAFICILPTNVKNTLADPETLMYMGFPVSDIIASGDKVSLEDNIKKFTTILENDKDVTKWAIYTEEQYKVKHADGQVQQFRTTVGDQTLFYPVYSSGVPPVLSNEIALTYLLAKDLQKDVGDGIVLEIDGEERHMLISGIYADTSNGGRTMRSCLEQNISEAFFWTANINVSGDITKKLSEYQNQMNGVTMLTKEETRDRFVGGIIGQMDSIGVLLTVISMLVSALITALFIKMLAAKEISQIAVMKSLGFTQRHIRRQYSVRIGLILLTGIVTGTLCANIGGEGLMGTVCAMLGAAVIKLIIKPVEVYAILPIALLTSVYITLLVSCRAIRKISISQINTE